jgi:thiol-disulfide isomerase/thioredoxin
MKWLVGLCLVACGRGDPPPPPSASVLHPEAPTHTSALSAITLPDATGKATPLAGRMRDVTMFAFWASWCGPCQQEMPLVDRYAASETDERIAIVAINLDEQADHQAAVNAARRLHLPVVFDADERLYEAIFHTQDAEIPALAVVSPGGIETESGFDGDLTDAQHVAHFRELAHAPLR